jgi:hypothetical protein
MNDKEMVAALKKAVDKLCTPDTLDLAILVALAAQRIEEIE